MSASDPTQVDTQTLLKSLRRDVDEVLARLTEAHRWTVEARATIYELEQRAAKAPRP